MELDPLKSADGAGQWRKITLQDIILLLFGDAAHYYATALRYISFHCALLLPSATHSFKSTIIDRP